ncbi:MAG: GNAT family N-acetyltransferase [Clostridium sp.]|nr:GNAT family N-acetyltransferase [Clostridium sp.]MBQ8998494.1 GNAT family N-acetyltransferase [Clostridium sp.]
MRVYCVNGDEITEFLNNFNKIEVSYESFSGGIYNGFDIFSPIDLDEPKCKFIFAADEENILGVIKFKRYKMRNHDYLSEEEFKTYKTGIKNYKGIMFVDVKDDYRRNGIAKEMIKYLCDITKAEGPKTGFRLGKLTPLGKKANLISIFKTYLPNGDIKL